MQIFKETFKIKTEPQEKKKTIVTIEKGHDLFELNLKPGINSYEFTTEYGT